MVVSEPGIGQIRVFAIGNPLVQALIRPLHDWVMAVLRTMRTDGTYNQPRPLEFLKRKKDLYSFDLKAATDSLPVALSGSLLAGLFGDELARVDIMAQTAFRCPEPSAIRRKRCHVYRFTKGQPLGLFSH